MSNLEKRVEQLEKEVAELKGQVSAQPQNKSFLKQYPKANQFINAYLECLTSVAEGVKDSKSVSKEVLFMLNDGIRIIHHIKKIVNEG